MKRLLTYIIGVLIIISFACGIFAAGEYDQSVYITKNPTSESISIGGKTWFIAHAENALTLSWEIIDPSGNIYQSLYDVMNIHPGLSLESLPGDTIAVSNVPLSFNGWGVQARFDGPVNSATTEPAYVYVGDFLSAYSSVIEKYRNAKLAGINNLSDTYIYDVGEWTIYGDHIGYAMKDLNKDGIPELIIANIGLEYENQYVINDLYTLSNNIPVRLLSSGNRARMFLLTDNRVYMIGSGGASIAFHELYIVNGDSLELNECFYSYYDSPDYGPYFYHTTSANDIDLGTPPKNYDYRFPLEEFHNTVEEGLRAKIWLPHLTTIV